MITLYGTIASQGALRYSDIDAYQRLHNVRIPKHVIELMFAVQRAMG